jgi:perosamine synthetase
MTNLKEDILSVLNLVCKKKRQLHPPFFSSNEKKDVINCINSTYVSTKGFYVNKFEDEIKNITKSKYSIATNTGTSALEIALRVVGVKPGDEVIIPALTFVATANSVSYCGAIPHFVDVSEVNFGIDPDKLLKHINKISIKKNRMIFNKYTGRKISAIIPVHIFGFPASMKKIKLIAKNFKLKIIEDASESLGSLYYGEHTGTLGDIGVFSFNSNKIVTTGAGGAIVTNNKKYAFKALHLCNISKIPHKWKYLHDDLGWNYRMPAINASLGLNQLKNLRKIIRTKRKISMKYYNAFKKKNIFFKLEEKNTRSNYWLNTIVLNNNSIKKRDEIINYLNIKGFNCRPAWNLLNEIKFYKKNPCADLSNSKKLVKQIINLPSGLELLM